MSYQYTTSYITHRKKHGNEKMRIDQTKETILKIKSKTLPYVFNEKYGLKFGEFSDALGLTKKHVGIYRRAILKDTAKEHKIIKGNSVFLNSFLLRCKI